MKKIYSLLLLVVSFVSFGQTFYSENMGTPSTNTAINANVFQNGSPIVYSGTADVRVTSPSTGYSGASGGGNVFLNAATEFFQIDGLNTSAYSAANIQLTFGISTPTAVTNLLVVEVSTNGGTSWTPVNYTPSGTGWTLATIAGGVIPSSTTLSIRFTSTSALQFRIDDVKLSNVSASCTLVLGTPTAACEASTAGTDSYAVTIPFTGAGNGTYTITPNAGTVGGDNPTTLANGNIVVTGVPEGTAFSATVIGVTCNFTVTIASPECDPINALPFTDSFNYTVGSVLGSSPFWTSLGTGDDITVASGNLTYTGINSTGNHVTFAGGGIDALTPLVPTTSGTIYYSYLLNVDSMTGVTDANGGYISAFTDGQTTFAGTVWTKRIDDTTFNMGLEVRTANATNTTFSTDVLQTGTTYLVVVGYTLGDSATPSDDTVRLWINPVVGGAQPATSITDTHTGTDITQISGFLLRQDSATETPSLKIDELRVGTTWSDVTGTLSVSENAILGLKIYPNPASQGIFFIETALNAEKNVAIYDLLGKQVVNTTTSSSEININNLNSGLYIVKITEEGKTATRKLVIE